MTDITTTYMGMELKSPIVPSASPLSHQIDTIRLAEDQGAGALVMYSLFEEQIRLESRQLDHHLNYFTEAFAESLDFFPEMGAYRIGPEEYLHLIQQAQEAVDMPIIGSLNGVTNDGWIEYAKLIEEAGADALELNVYYIPTDVDMTGNEVEQMYLNVLKTVRETISIPLAIKLNPYFSATANMAKQLSEQGADALVLFNRFYQPDLDIVNLEVTPRLKLSSSHELRLPLRWAAILYGRIGADIAITSGIHTHVDVLKAMMAGANVAMMASELLMHGVERIGAVLRDLQEWMVQHEYESIQQMRGSLSQQHVEDASAFERANYMKVLASWKADPAGQSFRVGPELYSG